MIRTNWRIPLNSPATLVERITALDWRLARLLRAEASAAATHLVDVRRDRAARSDELAPPPLCWLPVHLPALAYQANPFTRPLARVALPNGLAMPSPGYPSR
jgi:hypothetical protein